MPPNKYVKHKPQALFIVQCVLTDNYNYIYIYIYTYIYVYIERDREIEKYVKLKPQALLIVQCVFNRNLIIYKYIEKDVLLTFNRQI